MVALLTAGDVIDCDTSRVVVNGSRIGRGQFSEVYPATLMNDITSKDDKRKKSDRHKRDDKKEEEKKEEVKEQPRDSLDSKQIHVAVKIEPSAKTLKTEAAILMELSKECDCVCEYHGKGMHKGNMFIVMERLGSNLAELRQEYGSRVQDDSGDGKKYITPKKNRKNDNDNDASTYNNSSSSNMNNKNRFSDMTVRLLGYHLLTALRQVHDAGYVHRDVKPANFAIRYDELKDLEDDDSQKSTAKEGASTLPSDGCRKDDTRGKPKSDYDAAKFYILDFGLCRGYLDSEGKVKPPRSRGKQGFRGSTSYASVCAHKGYELGRRDDLWSWFYILVECLYGDLPWRGLQHDDDDGDTGKIDNGDGIKHEKVWKFKDDCIMDSKLLLLDESKLPDWIVKLNAQLHKMEFDEQPDYDKIIKVLDPDFSHIVPWDKKKKMEKDVAMIDTDNIANMKNDSDPKASQMVQNRWPSPTHIQSDKSRDLVHRTENNKPKEKIDNHVEHGDNRSNRGDTQQIQQTGRTRSRSPVRAVEPLVRESEFLNLSKDQKDLVEAMKQLPFHDTFVIIGKVLEDMVEPSIRRCQWPTENRNMESLHKWFCSLRDYAEDCEMELDACLAQRKDRDNDKRHGHGRNDYHNNNNSNNYNNKHNNWYNNNHNSNYNNNNNHNNYYNNNNNNSHRDRGNRRHSSSWNSNQPSWKRQRNDR